MKKGKQFASLLLTGAMLLSFAPMSLRAVALSSEGVGQTLVMSGEDSSGVETTNINLCHRQRRIQRNARIQPDRRQHRHPVGLSFG